MRLTHLRPVNRHLLILPHFKKDKSEDRGFILPDSYEEEEKYISASVIDVAADCSTAVRTLKLQLDGDHKQIVVDRSMIEEFVFKDKKYHMILENYIVGIVCPL